MRDKYGKRLEKLYLQTYDMLFAYARSSLMNDALAEEAVQRTFRAAWQKPVTLFSYGSPNRWLLKTLKAVIRDIRRKNTMTM